jgi:hypothetical protein
MSIQANSRVTLVAAACLLVIALTRCWPRVDIPGAPCPCPQGYSCCGTLFTCLRGDDMDACPATFPSSSGTACGEDNDCPPSEACRAWTLPEGSLAGPQDCRTICSAAFPCAQGETCQFVPHGGLPLMQVNVARACVPEDAAPGCEHSGCSDCAQEQIGRTFCDDRLLRGCLLAMSPQCGVDCELVVVDDCQTPSACVSDVSGARCFSNNGRDPCVDHACASCAGAPLPGGVACDGDRVATCFSTPFPGDSCDTLCIVQSEACPEAWTCHESDAGPLCSPD